ncbi:unnamed protein product, partial [Candidula unifasciata]
HITLRFSHDISPGRPIWPLRSVNHHLESLQMKIAIIHNHLLSVVPGDCLHWISE